MVEPQPSKLAMPVRSRSPARISVCATHKHSTRVRPGSNRRFASIYLSIENRLTRSPARTSACIDHTIQNCPGSNRRFASIYLIQIKKHNPSCRMAAGVMFINWLLSRYFWILNKFLTSCTAKDVEDHSHHERYGNGSEYVSRVLDTSHAVRQCRVIQQHSIG